jgi:2-polyprenyl-3-methyl-5-hydroxy-6-metoxy-1,4-benzoquinol methylase
MTQSCCTSQGTGKFFSKSVRRFERRYRNSGLDNAQKRVVDGLLAAGIEGKSVLEIGCGVGGLHLQLLRSGASIAQGIDLSEAMIAEARKFADRLNLLSRVTYTVGDFATRPEVAKAADVVVMDKVLCCSATPLELIHQAAAKCGSLLAVSYPRRGFLAKAMFRSAEVLGELFRRSFHPVYHQPEMLEGALEREGLEEIRAEASPIWQIRIYRRKSVMMPDAGSSPAFGI